MARGLTIFTMVIAGIIVLVFGLDLAVGFPFRRPEGTLLMNICFILGGLLLGYLGWTTFRELE